MMLLHYMVILPALYSLAIPSKLNYIDFFLLVFSTMLIASAGYIANDLNDQITDEINKPDKVYIDKHFNRRTVLAIAYLLSFLSILSSILLLIHLGSLVVFLLLNLALSIVWWYAFKLKRTLVWGNLAVASMSASTIPLLFIAEISANTKWFAVGSSEMFNLLMEVFLALAIFAFLISLIREIVKDMEDVEGDKQIHCRTIPLVFGIEKSKMLVYTLSIITLLLLFVSQWQIFNKGLFVAFYWLIVAVDIPLIFFMIQLKRSMKKKDFHMTSKLLKFIMLTGILTVVAANIQI